MTASAESADLLARAVAGDDAAFAILIQPHERSVFRHCSMPPMSMWFSGRDAAAAFIEAAIFWPARPAGIRLVAGSCNGQPAFATYAPDASGRLLVNGLQVLQLREVGGSPLISALVSYRDAAIAIRCGLPEFLS